jgi:hypothetical protein
VQIVQHERSVGFGVSSQTRPIAMSDAR